MTIKGVSIIMFIVFFMVRVFVGLVASHPEVEHGGVDQ